MHPGGHVAGRTVATELLAPSSALPSLTLASNMGWLSTFQLRKLRLREAKPLREATELARQLPGVPPQLSHREPGLGGASGSVPWRGQSRGWAPPARL